MAFDRVVMLKLNKLSVHHQAEHNDSTPRKATKRWLLFAVIFFFKKIKINKTCCATVIKVKPQQLPGELLQQQLGAVKSPEAELKMLSVGHARSHALNLLVKIVENVLPSKKDTAG